MYPSKISPLKTNITEFTNGLLFELAILTIFITIFIEGISGGTLGFLFWVLKSTICCAVWYWMPFKLLDMVVFPVRRWEKYSWGYALKTLSDSSVCPKWIPFLCIKPLNIRAELHLKMLYCKLRRLHCHILV